MFFWGSKRRPKQKLQTNRRDSDKKGDKRPNHKSQNTDAQGTRAPATTIKCALWTSRRHSTRSPMIGPTLWVTMMDMGHPLHLIDLPAKLYRKPLAEVKVAGTLSEWFRVKKGVRQGCVLSLYFFNILAEMLMRDFKGWTLKGE